MPQSLWGRFAVFVLVVLPLAAAACDAGRPTPENRRAALAGAMTAPADAQKAGEATTRTMLAAREAEGPAAPEPDPMAARKLIRNGQLLLEVRDYGDAADRVTAIARSRGGYVADKQSGRREHDLRQGTLTVRVPADGFDEALAALKPVGKLLSESVAVQDLTRAYLDLETRLRVKRDTEGRLRDILRTRTAKLADVLEAERELARVTEEIERMEGERRYYDQQVALSTIVVTLREPEPALQSGAFQPIREAFRDSVRVLATSVAAIVYAVVALLPWLVLLSLLAVVVRTWRRSHARA